MVFNVLFWDISDMLIQWVPPREPLGVSNGSLGALFKQILLDLQRIVLAHPWALIVVGLVKQHQGFSIHSMAVSIRCRRNLAETMLVGQSSACGLRSLIRNAPVVFVSSMSL